MLQPGLHSSLTWLLACSAASSTRFLPDTLCLDENPPILERNKSSLSLLKLAKIFGSGCTMFENRNQNSFVVRKSCLMALNSTARNQTKIHL